MVQCLVVYPQRLDGGTELAEVMDVLPTEEAWEGFAIEQFTRFYRVSVRLPELKVNKLAPAKICALLK